jgi:hypothetical protein
MFITETQYFPPIEFFLNLWQHKKVCLEIYENYTKQTLRNRCYLLGANKIERLTVPVVNGNLAEKQVITSIKLDDSQNWRAIHWRTIRSAYGKAPFFMYYEDLIKDSILLPCDTLFELNERIIRTMIKILAINCEISYTATYQKNYDLPFVDKRNKTTNFGELSLKPYSQVFGNEFVSNLSILDLIFCRGNMAGQYLAEQSDR